NINAYTLSYLYWYLEEKMNMKFNYLKIWQQQSVPQSVLKFMDEISYEIRDILKRVDGNVTEYAKRIIAWDDVKLMVKINKNYDLSIIAISKDDMVQSKKIARNNEKFENDYLGTVSVYKRLEENPNYYKDMLLFIDVHRKEFFPKERDVIALLVANKFLSDKQSEIALQAIEKAELEGFGL
ncbi:hypothetical protein CG075_09420, partial [Listeria monocytogenes]|nr:hypothetical protein [Listeria monocytogenes]